MVAAYLDHEQLGAKENPIERLFINLVLVRVLFAHALVAAPRPALGWCAPLAPLLGDPRLGMTAISLSLSRVLPDTYPLGGKLSDYVDDEHSFGHVLDIGLIRPRIEALFAWSADELGESRVPALLVDGVPAYSGIDNAAVWNLSPHAPARFIRRLDQQRGVHEVLPKQLTPARSRKVGASRSAVCPRLASRISLRD